MRHYSNFLRFLLRHLWGLYLLLLCLSQRCDAQGIVFKPGTDTGYINRLLRATRENPDIDSSIRVCNKLLQMSIAANYNYGAYFALQIISKRYFQKNDFAQSIIGFKQQLSYSTNPVQKASSYFNIGIMYFTEGDYMIASENYFSALREIENDTTKKSRDQCIYIYNGLALIYLALKQDDKWLYYLEEGEKMARKEKMDAPLSTILIDKSNYYERHGKLDTAIICLLEAEPISKTINDVDGQKTIYEGFGNIYSDSGQYEKAISYFQAVINHTANISSDRDEEHFITASTGISEALVHLKRYKQAELALVPAIKKARSLKIEKNIIDGYRILANIYRATGQYKKALDCKDSLIAINDSLTGVEKAKAIDQMEIQYSTAEKDKRLIQNQLIIAQQSNKIARKNIWIISFGGSILLLLLVSTGVYLYTLNKQRSLQKENKIGILKAAVAGGDNERSRIARELHDGIGGMLSAAMMRFSSMHHEDPAITHTAAYKDAMGILREMGDEIRKTAHNLMPEVLLKQSLPEAVWVFCNNVQEGGKLKIDFQSYGSFDGLTQSYKLNIYRIIQELVKNVTIHAKADRVLIQLLQNENKLIVSVEDNGIGFNINEVKGGMGLNNIRTRASSLDGHFTIESEHGKGTTVIIEFETPDLDESQNPKG